MKPDCTLLWIILFVSSVSWSAPAPTAEKLMGHCLKQALHKNSPPDRDNARSVCLGKYTQVSLSRCLSEAGKMEYLLNADEAYKDCYYSRSRDWNTRSCLRVAKKLYTMWDRDSMRLDCYSQLESQFSFKNCSVIANSFEQMHYKERFRQACRDY